MVQKGWDKVLIHLDDGVQREGIAPLIISASRSTDIPAFHDHWLMHRLRRGYTRWQNPFNRESQYISFSQARLFVFWSKNPAPLVGCLDELDEIHPQYYFQFTVNDYESEGLEPGVPPLAERARTFIELSRRIGRERVIWRFDPLILAGALTVDSLVDRVRHVGDQLYRFTRKLVISFADIAPYAKVKNNLKRAGISFHEFETAQMEDMVARIAGLGREWGLEVATCAELQDFDRLGVYHNRCIDDRLIEKLFPEDRKLMNFLGIQSQSPVQRSLFPEDTAPRRSLKDLGQRPQCGCIPSKDIGQYNTCHHLCLYCYANTSARAVENNLQLSKSTGDSIVP